MEKTKAGVVCFERLIDGKNSLFLSFRLKNVSWRKKAKPREASSKTDSKQHFLIFCVSCILFPFIEVHLQEDRRGDAICICSYIFERMKKTENPHLHIASLIKKTGLLQIGRVLINFARSMFNFAATGWEQTIEVNREESFVSFSCNFERNSRRII